MIAVEIVGWFGTVLLVIAYGVVSAQKKKPTLTYQVLNGVGAVALIINGAWHGAWPSVGLNLVWFVIALVAIGAHLRDRVHGGGSNDPS